MSTVCLLRCHEFTPVERALVSQLRGWFGDRVILAADERKWPVKSSGVEKLSLTDGLAASLGLHPHADWAASCGDYALIAARAAFPAAAQFWMVEPDVYFATDRIEQVFAPLDLSDVDLILPHAPEQVAADLRFPHLSPPLDKVHHCPIPLVRASARLVDELAECRRQMTITAGTGQASRWPSDADVIATVARAAGLRMATLQELSETEGVADTITDRHTRLWRMSHLRAATPDGRIYHPAYPERRFVDALDRMAVEDPDALEPMFDRMADCLSPEEVFEFAARAAAALPHSATG